MFPVPLTATQTPKSRIFSHLWLTVVKLFFSSGAFPVVIQTHLSWLCPASLMLTSSVHSTSFSKSVWLNQLLLCRCQIVDEVAGIVDDLSIFRMCLFYKVAMFNKAPLNTSRRLFSVICGVTVGPFKCLFPPSLSMTSQEEDIASCILFA